MNFLRISQIIAFEALAGLFQTSAIFITSFLGSLFLLDTGSLGHVYGSACIVLALGIGYMVDFTILTGLILSAGSFATSIMLLQSGRENMPSGIATGAAVLFSVFMLFGVRQRLLAARREDAAIAMSGKPAV